MRKLIIICAVAGLIAAIAGTAQAVTETFNDYPPHTNTTGTPIWIYGDAPTNSEIIAAWELEDDGGGGGGASSAGIGTDGSNIYAFGTGSGENPGPGASLAILDVGMQDWGMEYGVIADYLGPDGRDLHGGWMDARTLLSGFTGQIVLGFVSDRLVPDEENVGEWELDEFRGPTFDVNDSFTWYHGDLDNYTSDYNDISYADFPDVKVLGVWIELHSNTTDSDIAGELRVDQIQLVPEPATIALLGLGALSLLHRKKIVINNQQNIHMEKIK